MRPRARYMPHFCQRMEPGSMKGVSLRPEASCYDVRIRPPGAPPVLGIHEEGHMVQVAALLHGLHGQRHAVHAGRRGDRPQALLMHL